MTTKYKKRTKMTLKKKVDKLSKIVATNSPEVKHLDVAAAGVTVDNNPTFFLAPYRNIIQGDSDFSQRIGDKLVAKKFNLRGTLYKTYVSNSFPTQVRVFAFIYKHNPDNITTAWSTIVNLYLTSATMNSTLATMAYGDWDNHASFKTLYDKTFVINHEFAGDKMKEVEFTINIPKKYQRVDYATDGSGVLRNELFIGMIQTADLGLFMDYQYRLQYTDP